MCQVTYGPMLTTPVINCCSCFHCYDNLCDMYDISFAFSALTLLVGWQEGQWRDAGVVVSGSRCRFAYGPADATTIHYLLLQ